MSNYHEYSRILGDGGVLAKRVMLREPASPECLDLLEKFARAAIGLAKRNSDGHHGKPIFPDDDCLVWAVEALGYCRREREKAKGLQPRTNGSLPDENRRDRDARDDENGGPQR